MALASVSKSICDIDISRFSSASQDPNRASPLFKSHIQIRARLWHRRRSVGGGALTTTAASIRFCKDRPDSKTRYMKRHVPTLARIEDRLRT